MNSHSNLKKNDFKFLLKIIDFVYLFMYEVLVDDTDEGQPIIGRCVFRRTCSCSNFAEVPNWPVCGTCAHHKGVHTHFYVREQVGPSARPMGSMEALSDGMGQALTWIWDKLIHNIGKIRHNKCKPKTQQSP